MKVNLMRVSFYFHFREFPNVKLLIRSTYFCQKKCRFFLETVKTSSYVYATV